MMTLFSFYPQLSLVRDFLKNSRRRVYLVGGALRDYYLKRQGTDLDFAVDQGAIALSRQFARRIKGAFVLLDTEHGSARVVKKWDGVIWTFDFTDWRGPSIQKDLALRDFTINSLAVDLSQKADAPILESKISRGDLKAGMVRMVNPKVFEDDPLRLMRAFSLQASLGFKIEVNTKTQIKKDAHLLPKVAAERIRDEFFKVLDSSRSYTTLSSMDRIGLLPQIIPQLTVMYKVVQGGYHHLDVWKHSLEVIDQLERIVKELSVDECLKTYLQEDIGGAHSRLALLKMAALLHDIGKPETRREELNRTSFHGHEHVGERITRQIARQLKVSVKEQYFLEDAVRMHLRPGYLSNFKRPSKKAIFRYLRDTKDEAASLAILALADQAATRGPLTTDAKHKHHAKICHMLIKRYFEIKNQVPKKRLLTGNDLIKVLKLEPSALFGKILSTVEESAALGKIKTKQEALIFAKSVVARSEATKQSFKK